LQNIRYAPDPLVKSASVRYLLPLSLLPSRLPASLVPSLLTAEKTDTSLPPPPHSLKPSNDMHSIERPLPIYDPSFTFPSLVNNLSYRYSPLIPGLRMSNTLCPMSPAMKACARNLLSFLLPSEMGLLPGIETPIRLRPFSPERRPLMPPLFL